jgi:hypothetical protein
VAANVTAAATASAAAAAAAANDEVDLDAILAAAADEMD